MAFSVDSQLLKDLKVAIVHDWLTGYRGGEKVLEKFCEFFPQAPIYTLVHDKGTLPESIESRNIKTSFIQNLPFGIKKYRHFLPLFPWAAETLLKEKYDLIVSDSSAVTKSIDTLGAPHWCYIHSPMRYVWDRFDDYFGPKKVGPIASRLFFGPIAKALRSYDKKTAPRVQQFVANSTFVAERVRQFYGRDSEVIHPPVDTSRFLKIVRSPTDHYLFFSALAPNKRADLAILACQKLKRNLVVVGNGPELKNLEKIVDSRFTKLVPRATDKEIENFYSTSRALIFPGVEDFGIVPVEANASGLPVIGLKKGGLLDSQSNETCQFFDEETVDSLISGIELFEKKSNGFSESLIRESSKKFSNEVFEEKVALSISSFIKNNLK